VVIHNQSYVPLIQQEGELLSTNYQTDFGISRSFIRKLESPYSSCVKGNCLILLFIFKKKTYVYQSRSPAKGFQSFLFSHQKTLEVVFF
jgi:hypothetical protein